MNKIELLAPAGNLSRLKIALAYGADAVYAGGDSFSLRVRAKNFTDEELAEGIEYTHSLGKKFYLALNVIPHNEDIDTLIEYVKQVKELKPDAFIISDLGAFNIAKEYAPEIPIHVSTQANNVNYMTVDSWHKMGAERVVLARELSFDEVKTIREKTSPDLELEAFVHGAMCISYSGRCLLSGYMTGRESNSGDCAHPCRWNYTLMEEKRPGEHFPVYENDRGTFIFNSKDMCMIEYIPELINSGVTSFKIEGRVKTGLFDISFMTQMPNMLLLSPANFTEFTQMIEYAASGEHAGPIAIRYPRGKSQFLCDNLPTFEIGVPHLVSGGKDICILACGNMTDTADKVREKLEAASRTATVVNLRTLYPLNKDFIRDIAFRHNLVVTLEDGAISGGIGEKISAFISSLGNRTRCINIGYPAIVTHGDIEKLRRHYGLDSVTIADELLKILN